jgi:F-type H+-transporting ATPase subunit epsilon
MAEHITLRLVTPGRLLLDEEVEEVTAPGSLGQFGVLPNHITFLTLLEAGEMSYKQGGDRRYLALSGGYAEVLENVMTVLADAAEYADEIDVERARGAEQRAEQQMAELGPQHEEFPAAEAALRRARVRVEVATKGARR